MLSLDTYPKVLSLLMVVPPVLLGQQLRPQKIWPLLPLVFYFVEGVIHKTLLFNMVLISEGLVTVVRIQV